LDPYKLKPVARLGAVTWSKVTDTVNITRPSWKKDGEEVVRFLEDVKGEESS
jgi:hypothetical protein